MVNHFLDTQYIFFLLMSTNFLLEVEVYESELSRCRRVAGVSSSLLEMYVQPDRVVALCLVFTGVEALPEPTEAVAPLLEDEVCCMV